MAKGFTYKSYSFVDKDPIIDEIRTVFQDSGVTKQWIEEQSGVTSATLHAWFEGKTRRPQAATVNAVLASATLGCRLESRSTRSRRSDGKNSEGTMSVNFKVEFTISGEALFALFAKLLPIEDISIEEVLSRVEATPRLAPPR